MPGCAPLREPTTDTFVMLAACAPTKLTCVRYDASTLPGVGLTVTPPPTAADCSSVRGAQAGAEAAAACALPAASAAHQHIAAHASEPIAARERSRGALIEFNLGTIAK